jgi:AcrR family transcriptional regulator
LLFAGYGCRVAARRRRTQAERTAATRTRLLDATIGCLNELGYAGASTTAIARRAGLSRGAQLHHFPSKDDLVLAAIEHVFHKHSQRFRAAIGHIADSEDRIVAAIDLLWEAMSSEDVRYAWIEIVVGTRTDPVLQRKVAEVAERLGASMVQTFNEYVAVAVPLRDVGVALATAMMDGLLLHRMSGAKPEREQQILANLKTIARIVAHLLRGSDASRLATAELAAQLSAPEPEGA